MTGTLVVQIELLEDNDFGVFVDSGDSFLDGLLTVAHLILLSLEGVLLEELGEASLGDVLDHLLVQVGSLFGADGLDDLAGLGSLLGGDPALGGVGLDVILGVNVCRVDTSLLEGSLDSLLNLLFLGLLDSDFELVVDDLLRAVSLGDGYRAHGSDLHYDTLCEIGRNFLVESNQSTELAGEGVDVLGHERSLYGSIVSDDGLLAGLTGLDLDSLLHGGSVRQLASEQSLGVGRELGDGHVGDGVGETLEVGVTGNEVGFAAEADKDTLVTLDTSLHGTFGGLAVCTLGSYELTLLTDDIGSLLEIAFSLFESLLAIHHTCGGHLA